MKIISFGGRIASGKGELSKICEEYGFTIVRFATALKCLVSELVGFEIMHDTSAKDRVINLILSSDQMRYISDKTSIPYENVANELEGKHIIRVRDALQLIGTNLIRKYNPNWHVDKLREEIYSDKSKNYVIEDMRYPNEKNMIDEMGGECWYIVRPTFDHVSNHRSEISLSWYDFGNHVIINDSTLSNFKDSWREYMSTIYMNDKKYDSPILGCYSKSEFRSRITYALENHEKFDTKRDIICFLREYLKGYIEEETINDDEYFYMLLYSCLIPIEVYLKESVRFRESLEDVNSDFIYVNRNCAYEGSGKNRHFITDNPLVIENMKRWIK